jgi:hypothetical protein
MKNFDLFPLDEFRMQRVKKFAEMHERFGGISIDVIAGDQVNHQYLVRVKDKKGGLTNESLIQKAQEVFSGEVPEDHKLYYTVMEEDSKHYLTWDQKYVIRVHKYFAVWEIKGRHGLIQLEPTIPIIYEGSLIPAKTLAEQARKWVQYYLIRQKNRS